MSKNDSGDNWEFLWEARVTALESLLGKAEDMVGHAVVPFELGADVGGAADILYFKQKIPGVIAVTAELIGRDDQKENALGNYELAICHRSDESWGPDLISRLSYYTLEAELHPGHTMDIGPATPEGSSIEALMFHEFGTFDVMGRPSGILLCLGITANELLACKAGRRDEVEEALRQQGVFPYTDLQRESVSLPKMKWLPF